MKIISLLCISVFTFCFASSVYCDQFKMFEHRYDYKLEDVLQAVKFVQKKGYWEGYKDNKLVGYVTLSKDWTKKLVGYSGKHLETLIGMDTKGNITGVKLLFHSEPIVLIGIKEENYLEFIKQYKGKRIQDPVSVGKDISMDALTGATVTAVVQNSIVLESARRVASETGVMKDVKSKGLRISQKYGVLTWDELRKSGAVKELVVTSRELGLEGDDNFINLYVSVVTPPAIGRNLLGDNLYSDIMSRLKGGGSAVAVFSKGKGSFKGSGFVRGGVFDRFNIEQGSKVLMFRDRDYRVLSDIRAKGAPSVNEGGIFMVEDKAFDPTASFRLNLLFQFRASTFNKDFKSYSIEYVLPDRFLE